MKIEFTELNYNMKHVAAFKWMALFFVIVTFSSCSNKSERDAVVKVANEFGGSVTGTIGYVKTTEKFKKSGKYFQLLVEDLDASFFNYYSDLRVPASKSAFIFFDNIKKDEFNYDFIRVIYRYSLREEIYEYSVNDLLFFKNNESVVGKMVKAMCNGNCMIVSKYFDKNVFNQYAVNRICDSLRVFDNAVKGNRLIVDIKGFDVVSAKPHAIKVFTVVKAAKLSKAISVIIEPDNGSRFIAGLYISNTFVKK
ncbi:hypothetical protein F0P96_04235 [Hymenobacter busanensis]|uniref:Uncharacterized protein n=1 Tax=Hymenobacter busanensis TaxID=2607656 RepID=A0A7L4ZUC4_9BACT|nr:hypothetical protein [Hymenobacter busanensis]KAA9339831.1 hypothetical protein F0P96_04235 [Hymenobacter busanensis]QHJ06416.1 hypothetical protein GUY19_03510 [Hymenobacter busanensis]